MFVLMEQYLLPEKRITYWKIIWQYFQGLFSWHFSSIRRGESNYEIDKLILDLKLNKIRSLPEGVGLAERALSEMVEASDEVESQEKQQHPEECKKPSYLAETA